jgi:type IV pilus assembly protein PilA
VLKHLQERRQDEQGFTLIELMVVVLIMGILMAIAIPTFLSTQGAANDSSAKSNATNAYTAQKAYFEDNQVFIDSGHAEGAALDSQLPWEPKSATGGLLVAALPGKGLLSTMVGTNAAPNFAQVALTPWTGNVLVVYADSQSNNCFYILDDESQSPPLIGWAESSGGCFTMVGVAIPTALTTGNAGANIAAGAAPTKFYAKW